MEKTIKPGFSSGEKSAEPVVLALETGIKGGSISLFRASAEIDFWIGNGIVSRSEDILEAVDYLFRRNGIEKTSVDVVVTSAGPGSFTGLRIGASIAKGFCRSINCRHESKALLETLIPFEIKKPFKIKKYAPQATTTITTAAAVVPFGRNQIGWQLFSPKNDLGEYGSVQVGEIDRFWEMFETLNVEKIFFHSALSEDFLKYKAARLSDKNYDDNKNINLVDAGENMAAYLALSVENSSKSSDLIIYAGSQQFR